MDRFLPGQNFDLTVWIVVTISGFHIMSVKHKNMPAFVPIWGLSGGIMVLSGYLVCRCYLLGYVAYAVCTLFHNISEHLK